MTVSLVRYQPFTRMGSLRRAMDRLFDERYFVPYRLFTFGTDEITLIDLYHTDKEVVVKAKPKQIKPKAAIRGKKYPETGLISRLWPPRLPSPDSDKNIR